MRKGIYIDIYDVAHHWMLIPFTRNIINISFFHSHPILNTCQMCNIFDCFSAWNSQTFIVFVHHSKHLVLIRSCSLCSDRTLNSKWRTISKYVNDFSFSLGSPLAIWSCYDGRTRTTIVDVFVYHEYFRYVLRIFH